MNNTGTSRNWAIIGVVGKTDPEGGASGDKLLNDAEAVGKAIALRGHAVLTGGHHGFGERSVKYRALKGATAAKDQKCARLIGVIPRTISWNLQPPFNKFEIVDVDTEKRHSDLSGTVRFIYVHTQLKSDRRDAITGQIADVLIALKGEKGTPREVAAALIAGRPVVFFNSLDCLKTGVVRELDSQQKQPECIKFPRLPLVAATAQEALDKALVSIGFGTPSQRLEGCYPDMATCLACNPSIANDPDATAYLASPDVKAKFDIALSEMSRSCRQYQHYPGACRRKL